jgi:hypothetical protein
MRPFLFGIALSSRAETCKGTRIEACTPSGNCQKDKRLKMVSGICWTAVMM